MNPPNRWGALAPLDIRPALRSVIFKVTQRDFFRGAARSRAFLGSKITSLHHTAPCMFCHTAAAETEQGTHYFIFGVWILEVVTQVIFTERIQFTE